LSENYPDTWQYFYGALFVGAVVLFPSGIVGAYRRLVAEFEARILGRRSPVAAPPPAPVLDMEVRGVTND
jgi:urea transport system permease protein